MWTFGTMCESKGLDMSEKKSNFCKRQFFATDEIALHPSSSPKTTSQVCIENHEKVFKHLIEFKF